MRPQLPAVSDRDGGDDFDGDADLSSSRRSPSRRSQQQRREQRDKQIVEWAKRQQKIRGAQTARPSMREFYLNEEARAAKERYQSFSMSRPTYPPASAR